MTAAIDSSVSSNVQDCVRLGRYRADGAARHPRPVLVNEVSTGPVTGTLSRGYRSGSHTRGDIRMRIMIFT